MVLSTDIVAPAGKKATAFINVKARKAVDYSKRIRYKVMPKEFLPKKRIKTEANYEEKKVDPQ